jgi:dipeptidyl aminopeptidase/acylaminoacyl peptidase
MAQKTKRSKSKPGLKAEDLYKLRLPTSVAISPNELLIAYTVERMDRKQKKYFTNIHLYDIDLEGSRQFTYGDQVDSQPVWSPDGQWLAFVSTRDKKTGIYIMPADGGAERQIKELDGAITNLQFHPDGDSLVFGLRYNDSHFIKDEDEKKKPPVYRHITRLWYRLDATGFLPKDEFQVYVLSVEGGELRKITPHKRASEMPCLSPDGKWVAFASNRCKNPDRDSLRIDLFVIPFKGGKERRIVTPAGPVFNPTFSPDSKTIAYIGHDNPNDAWGVTNMHVWKVGIAGKPKARNLMAKFDRHATDSSIGDMGEFHGAGGLFWSRDGRRIYFLCSDIGATNVFYVTAGGGKPTRVYKNNCHIKAISLGRAGKRMAVVRSNMTTPGDVQVCPLNYGAEKKAETITDLNPFIKKERFLGRTREVMFRSFDGTRVQGFLVTPPSFRPTRKYPSILQIHGGPRAQYAFTLDCMAAADWLEKQKWIDSKRMGVTGGSYGGYMTNWIIGHTNRFKAAVTQRAVVDLVSFFGTSDIGWETEREFNGSPWTNRENFINCSPIYYYENVRTPVLIIHSEQDLRCASEQAEQMFVKLKCLGKTVELVRFPEEPHGLSRHGRPDRRIARLEWIVKWFDRYLKR